MDTCNYCHFDDSSKSLWVQCDACPQWVHVTCIPLKHIHYEEPTFVETVISDYPSTTRQIVKFQCDKHEAVESLLVRPPKGKKKRDAAEMKQGHSSGPVKKKRHGLRDQQHIDYIALNEGDDKKLKHVHPHTDAFLSCFQRWENTTNLMDSDSFNRNFSSVQIPLKLLDPENSGMKIPNPKDIGTANGDFSLTVNDIAQVLGDDYPVDVMDIQTQQNERWNMSQWNEYFTKTKPEDRDRIRNVISLEVSHVAKLKINRPKAVEDNDMINIIWELFGNGDSKPKVTRYILMSAANSYTDFHLDFAGTSVYYNLISGNKKFILFPPTKHNLRKYADWCSDLNQNIIFLGDLLQDGIAMELKAGDLFMIPSGYIHAVYTPVDSLIIGGNFLTVRDIEMQLQVVTLEKMTKVPKRFTFPKFDQVMGKCCEWVLSLSKTHEEKCDHKRLPVTSKAIEALIRYMENAESKYKPINYSSKRAMMKKLHEL